MENQSPRLDDRGCSSNDRSMRLGRFRRSTHRSWLVLPLTIAIVLGVAQRRHQQERAVVSRFGPTHHFSHTDTPVFTSLGPHVIIYYGGIGPAFLESPMRRAVIPWFDRIIRVEILDDSHVSRESLSEISRLDYLEQFSIIGSGRPRQLYNDIVGGNAAVEFFDHPAEPMFAEPSRAPAPGLRVLSNRQSTLSAR